MLRKNPFWHTPTPLSLSHTLTHRGERRGKSSLCVARAMTRGDFPEGPTDSFGGCLWARGVSFVWWNTSFMNSPECVTSNPNIYESLEKRKSERDEDRNFY